MITFPTGSGILLCPTGVGFSTISEDLYVELEAAVDSGEATLEEIEPSVYQEWLSNAKEITVTDEVEYSPLKEGFENSISTAKYKQGVFGSGGMQFNDSGHPFPMMTFFEVLSFQPSINQGQVGLTETDGYGFGYYQTDDSGFALLSFIPFLFIRNDKFYWYVASIPNYTFTLTETELKVVDSFTFDYTDPETEEESVITSTRTITASITDQFY
jgi:hypothetical protein